MDIEDKEKVFDFNGYFQDLTGHAPFGWQRRLYEEHFMKGGLPSALDLPTGLGKTSVMAIWYLARRAGAPVPRRLVYVVDRRAVVDQATAVAEAIKERSRDSALRISTLRGRYADNREWLEDPAAPAIIVGTVDMIGSRLLFEGYGVSRGMRPYHAGLLGTDALVVLDESHLVPPFERLLERIARDRDEDNDLGPQEEKDRDLIPCFRLLPLSATGRDWGDDVFRLTEKDREDPVVKQRLGAKKRLVFKPVGDKKLEERLAEEAWTLSGEGNAPVRVLVYCNSRDVAEKTKKAIEKLKEYNKNEMESARIPPENVQLFVGARRVKEREDAKKKLEELGFFSGNDAPDKPAFVIATSAGEVGVDLDADHMVMDLVPFERMVQRLGRVNRLGGERRKAHIVVIEEPDKSLPDDLKERAQKTTALLRKFLPQEDKAFQAGSGALIQLKEALENKGCEQCIRDASSPDPLYPALTRPLLDAWSMTNLKEHTGQPEVQPWLRGWIDDPPQTTLVWRKFLPVRVQGGAANEREVADFFAVAPPHLTEVIEVPTSKVHEWLFKRAKNLDEAAGKAGAKDLSDSAGNTDAADPAPLNEQRIVAIGLGRSGEDAELFTLDGLITAAKSKNDKETLKRSIGNRTMILDARMGGLSDDGLFDPQKKEDAWTPDNDDAWETVIGFRVRSITPDAESPDAGWHKPHLFDLRRDGEGRPLRQLRVEKYRDATATEEERSLSPKQAQKLEEHQELAARKAEKLVGLLELPDNIGKAIVLAAQLHDEGKRADNWQRAFSAGADDVYAKTKGPFLRSVLAGYRHEFGSLTHVERNDAFEALPNDLRDLVLHLVAAHHGRARPCDRDAGLRGRTAEPVNGSRPRCCPALRPIAEALRPLGTRLARSHLARRRRPGFTRSRQGGNTRWLSTPFPLISLTPVRSSPAWAFWRLPMFYAVRPRGDSTGVMRRIRAFIFAPLETIVR